MRGNPAFQVRALANLLNNYTVSRLGGAIDNKFGYHAVVIQMATPDPKAVFLVRWQFQVSGDATIHTRETVAAAFAGPGKKADGKMFRIPGTLLDPDGKSLEGYEHSWAREQTMTSILVGEPLDMRANTLPGHKWQHKTIVGLEVSVRRLTSQCFAMPRSGSKEWTHAVDVDLRGDRPEVAIVQRRVTRSCRASVASMNVRSVSTSSAVAGWSLVGPRVPASRTTDSSSCSSVIRTVPVRVLQIEDGEGWGVVRGDLTVVATVAVAADDLHDALVRIGCCAGRLCTRSTAHQRNDTKQYPPHTSGQRTQPGPYISKRERRSGCEAPLCMHKSSGDGFVGQNQETPALVRRR